MSETSMNEMKELLDPLLNDKELLAHEGNMKVARILQLLIEEVSELKLKVAELEKTPHRYYHPL